MTPATAAHRLHDLRAELRAIRAAGGYGSASRGKEAFDRLVAEAERQGRSLTMLNTRSPDEVERFFAWTVPGPDGHVYWTGAKHFARNDGKKRRPRRWWWVHKYGNLNPRDDLVPTCDDRACINPEHAKKENVRGAQRTISDTALIGMAQVLSMRLGRTPTTADWDRLGLQPSRGAVRLRFGSWGKFIAAAGLPPAPKQNLYEPITAEVCVAALCAARDFLGHWPTWTEFTSEPVGRVLRDAELPTDYRTIWKHLGKPWSEALRKAGAR